MLDVAVAYNRYKFLGDEFLTWLWFVVEKDHGLLKKLSSGSSTLEVGNRMVLENRRQKTLERITIRGDDANLEEGVLALRKGALVSEINLCFKSDDQEWRFTIKGESMNISGLKTPPSAPAQTDEEVEGAVIEKVYLCEQAIQLIDKLFNDFIKQRLSTGWQNRVVPSIRKWIYA